MATLTIRNLDDGLKARLRVRAAERGHSMEEEARELLKLGLVGEAAAPDESLASIARRLFGPEHGVELELLPREPMREPPSFE